MSRALIVLQNDDDRERACRWAKGVPLGSRIEFKETKRTLPQNDLMWALLTEVAQQMEHGGRKYTPDEWKSIFLHAFGREISFLPSLDMKTFLPIELSSSDLGKDEMTNFIEFIIKEGTERGVVFKPFEASASPPPGDADVAGDVAARLLPEHPAAEPVSSAAGSDEPDMFGKFSFAPGELQHLKDYARKALQESIAHDSVALCTANIERMKLNYREVVESKDGLSAIDAMDAVFPAIYSGKRTVEQAASYIARELLGCAAEDLEGRK